MCMPRKHNQPLAWHAWHTINSTLQCRASQTIGATKWQPKPGCKHNTCMLEQMGQCTQHVLCSQVLDVQPMTLQSNQSLTGPQTYCQAIPTAAC